MPAAAGQHLNWLGRRTAALTLALVLVACIDEHAALVLFDRPEAALATDAGAETAAAVDAGAPDSAAADAHVGADISTELPDAPPADTELDNAETTPPPDADLAGDATAEIEDSPAVNDADDVSATELPPADSEPLADTEPAGDATATDAGPAQDAAADVTAIDLCAAITSCDDGNPCTSGEACAGGVCLPGALTNCDDGNECTADTCDLASGCTATALPDGATCPVGVCAKGVCKAPPAGMAWIGAGSFALGCTAGDKACQLSESPTATVTLAGHYLDLHETTAAEYGVCVAGGGCTAPAACGSTVTFVSPAKASHPVNCVTWEQAVAYCAWQGGRLPTEAEWERAARGGKADHIFGWGNQPPGCDPGLPSFAVWAAGGQGCGLDGTWPAQSGLPLGFGMLGMAGNVREWVADWFAADAYATVAKANPTGPAVGSHRVVRGGSCESGSPIALRNSARAAEKPTTAAVSLGFRCAKDGP